MFKKKSAASVAFSKRRRAINFFIKNPILTQENVFNYLIKKAAKTQWGVKHLYGEIKSVRDFQERVPIGNYEDFQPYIERLIEGDKNLLWPGKVKYFAKSSGTTSAKSKYLPVTKEALRDCHYRGGKSVFASYLAQKPDSKLVIGQSFALGGSRQDRHLSKNKYIADVSMIIMKNLPLWAQIKRSPRLGVASLQEWESKIDRIAKIISKRNIVSLSGVPSWNLVLARKILEINGAKSLLEVWPNLELFVHGGISFTPYRAQYEKLIPSSKMNYLEVYNASEGFFAFQDDLKRNDMLLNLDGGVFYEFLPLEELGKDNPQALTLDKVQLGKNYAIIISTNAGLWRYMIGDTVRFTHRYPFRIVVSGRTKSFINAFGEELIIENADRAIAKACEECGAIVKDYTAAPVYMTSDDQGAHQWLIEFEKKPDDVDRFTIFLDEELKKLNSDYEAKRYKDMTLAPPELTIARPGLFYDWLKQKNRLGGQYKVPRLANDRHHIDQLLALNRE